MSLYFVCGKVGAGKSYRGVVSIVDQLVHDDRLIVTNLPVNLGKLADFLAKRYPERNICLLDHRRPANPGEEADADGMAFEPSRVRVLDEGELAEFYRIRHQASEKVPRIEREREDRNPVCLDFSQWLKGGKFSGRGVIYHLDELQLFYNVRRYAEAPNEETIHGWRQSTDLTLPWTNVPGPVVTSPFIWTNTASSQYFRLSQ